MKGCLVHGCVNPLTGEVALEDASFCISQDSCIEMSGEHAGKVKLVLSNTVREGCNSTYWSDCLDPLTGKFQICIPDTIIYVGSFGGDDVCMWKLDNDGKLIFNRYTYDDARAIALDVSGNIYLGGNSINNKGVRKLDSSGRLIWGFYIGRTIFGVAVDVNGNVAITGERIDEKSIWKLDSDGNEVWHFDTGGRGYAVAVDADGNTYVAADIVYKFDSDGNVIWTFEEGNPNYAITVDADGNVYVGKVGGLIWKLDSDGNEVWHFDANNTVRSIVVDADGNVYAGGHQSYNDVDIWKLDSSGNLLWSFATGNYDDMRGIALDSNGNVYAVGEAIWKLDNDGNEIWSSGITSAVCYGIVIDANDNLFIASNHKYGNELTIHQISKCCESLWARIETGATYAIAADTNYVYSGNSDSSGQVRKYNFDGNTIWRYDTNNDVFGVAVDADEYVYATGYLHDNKNVWKLKGFAWEPPVSITAFSDAGDGKVNVEAAAHGLATGEPCLIADTVNYNGHFAVTVIDADNFEILHAWDGDDGTGDVASGHWSEPISIDSFSDAGDGKVNVEATAHELLTRDMCLIMDSSNYNGHFAVTVIDVDNFEIEHPWVGNGTATPGHWDIPIPIVAFSNADGDKVNVEVTAHGLATGEPCLITNTTNYDGNFTVTVIDVDNFEIEHSWDGIDNGNATPGHWDSSILIDSLSDAGSGKINVEVAGHGLATNDPCLITNTLRYNGNFTVTVIDADNFEIEHAWDGNGNVCHQIAELVWSALAGNRGEGIAVDANGNVYVAGNNMDDGPCVWKFNSNGSEVWTYTTGGDGNGIVVDASGNVFVAGNRIDDGGLKSVWKLNNAGTKIGGFDTGHNTYGIAIDAAGNVYVVGSPDTYGKTAWKLNNALNNLIWSSTVGGTARCIDVDSDNIVYVGTPTIILSGEGESRRSIFVLDSDGVKVWDYFVGNSVFGIAKACRNDECTCITE